MRPSIVEIFAKYAPCNGNYEGNVFIVSINKAFYQLAGEGEKYDFYSSNSNIRTKLDRFYRLQQDIFVRRVTYNKLIHAETDFFQISSLAKLLFTNFAFKSELEHYRMIIKIGREQVDDIFSEDELDLVVNTAVYGIIYKLSGRKFSYKSISKIIDNKIKNLTLLQHSALADIGEIAFWRLVNNKNNLYII